MLLQIFKKFNNKCLISNLYMASNHHTKIAVILHPPG